MVVPYRIAQEAKELEKATGYKVNWKQFAGGGEVIKAMASGAVQVGEVGSAGIAAAVSRGEPMELFWILAGLGAAQPALLHHHAHRHRGLYLVLVDDQHFAVMGDGVGLSVRAAF